jgi:anaerobic selenocysteine-containing dehydrogenase
VRALDWAEIFSATGLSQAQIRALAARLLASKATIVTWAMGLTQHKHAVATLRDIVNVLLLQGSIGRPGAGLCPVRGHSNVEGTAPWASLSRCRRGSTTPWTKSSASPPRGRPATTPSAPSGPCGNGSAKVFVCMGGNFARATPDTRVTEAAISNTRLTVQISTKLNRSHAITGGGP